MSIAELMAQKAELEHQIAQRQREERGEAIKQVMSIMSQYGLTAADLGSGAKVVRISDGQAKASKRAAVAVKFRDQHGHTWTGRGIKPKWLSEALAAGKSLDDFRIAA